MILAEGLLLRASLRTRERERVGERERESGRKRGREGAGERERERAGEKEGEREREGVFEASLPFSLEPKRCKVFGLWV